MLSTLLELLGFLLLVAAVAVAFGLAAGLGAAGLACVALGYLLDGVSVRFPRVSVRRPGGSA